MKMANEEGIAAPIKGTRIPTLLIRLLLPENRSHST